MAGKVIHIDGIKGLSESEVPFLVKQHGKNIISNDHSGRLLYIALSVIREPMFIVLMVATAIYFILGENTEGGMMAGAIIFVAAISVYTESRSNRSLKSLRQYTSQKITVIRDSKEKLIAAEELVPGDVMVLAEGNNIPADAIIIQQNDLSVNESVITGESFPVEKNEREGNNQLFQGTVINSGKCYSRVTATGNKTVLGKLGKAVSGYSLPETLLEKQIKTFVRRFTLFGVSAFIVICLVNYFNSRQILQSLLTGLTLAMAVIPEEIPVAFSSFMALGAYQMARLGIITRQPQTIENLGAVSVFCMDKTGTMTENRMTVKSIYNFKKNLICTPDDEGGASASEVLLYSRLASEPSPFDAMEIAIEEAYKKHSSDDLYSSMKLVYEYDLQGKPPMMTHVYSKGMQMLATAKGAVEKILSVCRLTPDEIERISKQAESLAKNGYRVLGVASALPAEGNLPQKQEDFNWLFEGLISLYDPPRKNTAKVIQQLYDAGIRVKLITGDYPLTAVSIAGETGIMNVGKYISGEQVMNMSPAELQVKAREVNIFARMFPEAKLKVIEALKANGEIVAMTGDGVNDGPALKSADIGIAMGKKGTELARQAANLILSDDNLDNVVEAIRQGRKIFNNFKKAIRYIISIHIPIILTASLPLVLGWKYPNIFTPVHIIFLELIMGPTCSIFFEREPVEETIMKKAPRKLIAGLLTWKELTISILQGSVITAAILILYVVLLRQNYSLEQLRAVIFTTLIIANLLLTFVNRSFTENIFTTIHYKNSLAPKVILLSILFLGAILLVPFIRNIFEFGPMSPVIFLLCTGTAIVSVGWFEIYKSFFVSSD